LKCVGLVKWIVFVHGSSLLHSSKQHECIAHPSIITKQRDGIHPGIVEWAPFDRHSHLDNGRPMRKREFVRLACPNKFIRLQRSDIEEELYLAEPVGQLGEGAKPALSVRIAVSRPDCVKQSVEIDLSIPMTNMVIANEDALRDGDNR
jgi:hypothetical protein